MDCRLVIPAVNRVAVLGSVVDSQRVRRAWAERSGEYSPDYYAYYGPNETSEELEAVLADRVGREARVLELGCSSGRHLAHLHERGFQDLTGIEINPDAVEVMADAYPDLHDVARIHESAFQAVLPELADGAFDVAFSVETLQHVPPADDWVFAELARVADVVVTVENESAPAGRHTFVDDDTPLFFRDWAAVFTNIGRTQTECRDVGTDTLRVFE